MITQGELHAVFGGLESGVLQSLLEIAGIAPQGVERLDAVDRQPRGDVSGTVDIETHVDAAEFGWIEADLEPVAASLRARGDLDREAGERNGSRFGGGTRRHRRRWRGNPLGGMLDGEDLHAVGRLGLGDIAGVYLDVRHSRQFGSVCSYAADPRG